MVTYRIAVLERELADVCAERDALSDAHRDACNMILDRLGPVALAEHLAVEAVFPVACPLP